MQNRIRKSPFNFTNIIFILTCCLLTLNFWFLIDKIEDTSSLIYPNPNSSDNSNSEDGFNKIVEKFFTRKWLRYLLFACITFALVICLKYFLPANPEVLNTIFKLTTNKVIDECKETIEDIEIRVDKIDANVEDLTKNCESVETEMAHVKETAKEVSSNLDKAGETLTDVKTKAADVELKQDHLNKGINLLSKVMEASRTNNSGALYELNKYLERLGNEIHPETGTSSIPLPSTPETGTSSQPSSSKTAFPMPLDTLPRKHRNPFINPH